MPRLPAPAPLRTTNHTQPRAGRPMNAELVFDIPPDLWMSSTRMPTKRQHRHAIALGLHQIAILTARAHNIATIPTPVDLIWTVHYAKGTGKADAANAQPTTKRLLDGLVKVGLLPDDDDKYVKMESFVRGANVTQVGPLRKPARRIRLTLTPAAREEYPDERVPA